MITPQQAREDYGFKECSSREDQMALGLYHAAQGLFKNRFFLFMDYAMPFLFLILLAVVITGILISGAGSMLILVFGAAAIMFAPQYLQRWKQRSVSSGMYHFSQEQGEHFLIGYGVCAKKEAFPRRFPFPGEDYRLRVRFAKDQYLDDVRIMKELYEQVGEGARVCLMMADSPKARQVVAMPVNFADKVMDRKNGALQQFERLNPRRLRVLEAEEREYYIHSYQERIEEWNANYGKKYRTGTALFLAGGLVFLLLAAQSMCVLCWVMAVCLLFALRAQKKEFRGHLNYMKDTQQLEAVDVTVRREEGYTADMGTEKHSGAMVHFVDAGGLVLWSLRTREDLKRFRQHDRAVLIIHGKEMLPFRRM